MKEWNAEFAGEEGGTPPPLPDKIKYKLFSGGGGVPQRLQPQIKTEDVPKEGGNNSGF